MVQSSTLILFSLLGTAFATNDWEKPCLSGVCYYDLPKPQDGSRGASGTLKIWGAANAITDITTAAGWEIIDCDNDALAQDIRLVCAGDAKCDHLYKSIGAVGKIVRLPENCGSSAFAHISKAWVPKDQSIPEHISKRLARRRGHEPEVKALRLDTNFGSLDAKKVGVVKFELTGLNVPDSEDLLNSTAALSNFSDIKKLLKQAIDGITALNKVDVDKSQTLPLFQIDKNFNLFDQKVSCPPLEAGLKIDAELKAIAVATIGVAAEGTIIPPKINDIAIIASLSGEIDGAIDLSAGVVGSVDTGTINLVEIALPGLDFPGILTTVPTFRVDARANAALDISADINVGINYKIQQATLVFPPDSKKAQQQGGAFVLGDTPLKLSVLPSSAKATGIVEAHLIPSVNLGISALGGIVDARIFLELDASTQMSLNFEASARAAATVDTKKRQTIDGDAVALPVARREVLDIRGTGEIDNDYSARQVTTDVNGSFGGCFEISAGLDVNAGADAEFFGLFNADTRFNLFQRDFELFKKCFGNQAGVTSRDSLGPFGNNVSRAPQVLPGSVERRLTCALPGLAAVAQTLVDETILSAAIKPLN